nr:unnamed protein product [uncultured bacterium]
MQLFKAIKNACLVVPLPNKRVVVDFEKSFLYNIYTVTTALVGVRFTPLWEFSYRVGTGIPIRLRCGNTEKLIFNIMRGKHGLPLFIV